MRIVAFVGHPLAETERELETLGKQLKKANVSVDIVNFAHPENVPKLEALVNACNNDSNSHFLDLPLGIATISDILLTSPICMAFNGQDVAFP
jgi:26S proteasome regulatory subunit N10